MTTKEQIEEAIRKEKEVREKRVSPWAVGCGPDKEGRWVCTYYFPDGHHESVVDIPLLREGDRLLKEFLIKEKSQGQTEENSNMGGAKKNVH